MPLDASDMMVILKDRKEWTSADNYSDLADKMQKELQKIWLVSLTLSSILLQ